MKKLIGILTIVVFTISLLVNLTGCSNNTPFQPKLSQENQAPVGQLAKFTPVFVIPDTTKQANNDTTKSTLPVKPGVHLDSRYGVGTE